MCNSINTMRATGATGSGCGSSGSCSGSCIANKMPSAQALTQAVALLRSAEGMAELYAVSEPVREAVELLARHAKLGGVLAERVLVTQPEPASVRASGGPRPLYAGADHAF